jgi:uncharacterized protein YjiS (DUF1127 family)
MSMISRAPAAAQAAATPSWAALTQAKLGSWWARYKNRRIELRAMQKLEQMSDHDLRDIGLTRGEIPHAVTHEAAGDRTFRRPR